MNVRYDEAFVDWKQELILILQLAIVINKLVYRYGMGMEWKKD